MGKNVCCHILTSPLTNQLASVGVCPMQCWSTLLVSYSPLALMLFLYSPPPLLPAPPRGRITLLLIKIKRYFFPYSKRQSVCNADCSCVTSYMYIYLQITSCLCLSCALWRPWPHFSIRCAIAIYRPQYWYSLWLTPSLSWPSPWLFWGLLPSIPPHISTVNLRTALTWRDLLIM